MRSGHRHDRRIEEITERVTAAESQIAALTAAVESLSLLIEDDTEQPWTDPTVDWKDGT